MTPRDRRPAAAHALLMVAVLGVGLAHGWREVARAGPITDGTQYWSLAQHVILYGRFAWKPPPEPPTYTRLPGYPLALAALMRRPASELETARAAARANAVFNAGTGLALHGLLLECGLPPLISLGAVLAWLLAPQPGHLSRFTLTEPLVTLLLTLELWAVARAARRGSIAAALAAGTLAGLAQLVRADSLAALPAAGVALAACAWPAGRRLRLLGAFAASAVVVFAPWPIRNQLLFGAPHAFATEWIRVDGVELRPGMVQWMRTWCTSEPGQSTLSDYIVFRRAIPVHEPWLVGSVAYDTEDQRLRIYALMQRHNRFGMDATIDEGFRRLAAERTAARPLRTYLTLPLRRIEVLWSFVPPWGWSTVLALAFFGASELLLARRGLPLALLALPIATRSLLHSAVVPHQVSPRFVFEVLPLVFALAAAFVWGVAGSVQRRRAAARALTSRAPARSGS